MNVQVYKVVCGGGSLAVLGSDASARQPVSGRYECGRTHGAQTLLEPRLHMPEYLHEGALVVAVERGRVDEGEGEGVLEVGAVGRQVNVDRRGPDMRGVTAAALDELGDRGELIVGDGGGDVAGVEEKAEEGGLACAASGDH